MSVLDALFDAAPAASLTASHLALVVSVQDPDSMSRVQVRLLGFDGVDGQDAPLWARVAVPFAGNDCGAFMIPNVGDEVLVTFAGGDPRMPIVIGSLWNGADKAPDSLGGDRVNLWTIVGKAGTRIAIIEENQGSETIKLSTPGGVTATITDESGGKIELKQSGNTITMDSQGISIKASAQVKVDASTVTVTASMVKVDAAMAKFSGVVKCDVLQATTVVASTYTPGAGNVW